MSRPQGSEYRRRAGRIRPLGLLWLVWGVLAAAAYGKSVRTAVRLMLDPAAAGTVRDGHGNVVTGAAADLVRTHLTYAGAWLQISCAAAAVILAAFTQLRPPELGLRATVRSRYVVGRGAGAAVAYLFVIAAAAALTNRLLSWIGVAVQSYPGWDGGAHSAALAGAFLVSSAAAGMGEEILLFAVPIALARRSGLSPLVAIVLVTALRWTIHAYYGWGSLFVLLWIPAGYVLYRAAGSIWPLITAHAGYDALLFSAGSWPRYAGALTVAGFTMTLAGAAVICTGHSRYFLDRRAARQRSTPASARPGSHCQ